MEERERRETSGGGSSNTEEAVLDAFAQAEPGLEENKDFRKKLHKTKDTKIDTTAAFPSQKKKPEQLDFRNLLKKSDGPAKKQFKSGEQVDFRSNLKPKVQYCAYCNYYSFLSGTH